MQLKLPVDDTLDVWALHGAGGLVGTILVGIFADPSLCSIPHAMGKQVLVQAGAVYAVAIASFAITGLIFMVIEKFVSLRMDENSEERISREILEARKETYHKTE